MEKEILKLDKIDRKIIKELEINSRQSLIKLAKKVGISKDAVKYRINTLKQRGFVLRLFSDIDVLKIGMMVYRIYIKFYNLDEERKKAIINYIYYSGKSRWMALAEGKWDLIFQIVEKSDIAFIKFMEEFYDKFGSFIKDKNIVLTKTHNYLFLNYLYDQPVETERLYNLPQKYEEIDGLDKKIIYYLYENARMKTTEIAKKVGVSPDAVQKRIKNLIERNIIVYFTGYFEKYVIGYNHYKVFIWFQTLRKKEREQIVRFCAKHPNAQFIVEPLANWDIEVDFDVRNMAELHSILDILRNKFKQNIREYDILSIVKNYMPNPFGQFLEV